MILEKQSESEANNKIHPKSVVCFSFCFTFLFGDLGGWFLEKPGNKNDQTPQSSIFLDVKNPAFDPKQVNGWFKPVTQRHRPAACCYIFTAVEKRSCI